MNVNDRKDVNNLANVASGSGSSRQPLSLRDASGTQSQARPGAWGTQSGRPIATPGQSRLPPRRVNNYNPFNDAHSMKDTLTTRNGSSFGNPTSGKTVVSLQKRPQDFGSTQPRKRSKIEPHNAITNTALGGRDLQRLPTRTPKQGSGTREYHLVPDDDDEPLPPLLDGAGSSPDPLTLRPRLPLHPFDTLDPIDKQPSYIRETSNITKLRNQHGKRKRSAEVSDSEPEEIEQFPEVRNVAGTSTSGRAEVAEPGHVRKTVMSIERDNIKSTPHVDLLLMQRPIAGNMKKKADPHAWRNVKINKMPAENFGADTLSAPTLHSPKTDRKVPTPKDTKEGVVVLPLEAWSYGLKIFPGSDEPHPPYILNFNQQASAITVRRQHTNGAPNSTMMEIHINQIKEMTITHGPISLPDFLIIQIKTQNYACKQKLQEEYFNPGSSGADGWLTFKFGVHHATWSPTTYQTMVSVLKKNMGRRANTVDIHASKVIWQGVNDAVELKSRSAMRKESEAMDLNLQRTMELQRKARPVAPPTSAGSSRPRPRPVVKSNPDAADPSEPSRRSTRPFSHKSPSTDPDELILVYPPSGTGAMNITQSDLNRLNDGEYLNDTLIEFGLKLWLNDVRASDPDLAEQIHVFSSFFYKKLKSNTKDFEEGYQSVRKWTQKFDLFEKKYLVVPINENLHWYLAIIYQPEHTLLAPPAKVPSVSSHTRKQGMDDEDSHMSTDSIQLSREEIVNVSTPRSCTPDAAEVEEQFRLSCSISVEGPSSPSSSDPLALPPPNVDHIMADQSEESLSSPNDIVESGEDKIVLADPPKDIDQLSVEEIIPEHSATPSKPLSSASMFMNGSSKSRSSTSSSVTPASFYGSGLDKGKGKQKTVPGPRPFPLDVVDLSDDAGDQNEVAELLAESEDSVQSDRPTTYIFTLDSLGSKHPQAIKVLRSYLKFEAKDKKGIVNSSDAVGLQAHVITQPNFCDCGLYLLHLTKTFMKRPEHLCRVIRSKGKKHAIERREEWDDVDAHGSRAKLKARVMSMSADWKKEQVEKEEQRKKGGEQQESSDTDIDIVGETLAPKSKRPKPTKAKRVRG